GCAALDSPALPRGESRGRARHHRGSASQSAGSQERQRTGAHVRRFLADRPRPRTDSAGRNGERVMEIQLERVDGLRGNIRVPGDKSIAHRALLLGAIANGWTRIAGVPRSADVSATIRALGNCGVQIQRNDDAVIVNGGGREALRAGGATIDCANSGTTMRLLMGI